MLHITSGTTTLHPDKLSASLYGELPAQIHSRRYIQEGEVYPPPLAHLPVEEEIHSGIEYHPPGEIEDQSAR